ncbi:LysE family translocator [Terrarubrum flagellatum]|uniref:LysE family translocator n=1 Tax=Terrirubrum flagellatum TaxID=2895980 RepID=UPI0031455568
MTISGLILFASVYFLAAASPGPGVTALVARVLSRGTQGLGAFIAGITLGDIVWFAFAALGLSVLAQQFHLAFLVVKYAGVAYLLYLAWALWTQPAKAQQIGETHAPDSPGKLFLAGLALTLGNPKVMVFFMAILPTVVDLQHMTLTAAIEVGILMAVILSGVLAAYGLAADRARRLIASPRAMRLVNRVSGAALVGAAAAVATR